MPTPLRLTLATVVTVVSVATVNDVAAQLPDPYVVPRGALRVSFQPSYTNYNLLLDEDGNQIPLGIYFTSDSLGVGFFPTLAGAESAVRSITGDVAYRMSAGALQAMQDADVRRLPFAFFFGLSDRLTLTATIPFVTTRVQSVVRVDSSEANVGWNQASSLADDPGSRDSLFLLLGQLDAAANALDAEIAAGSFGCPSSALCDQARLLADRARAMLADLTALAGTASAGETGTLPPFAPLAGSAAGTAIRDAIAILGTELQGFGITSVTTLMPLPAAPVGSDAASTVVTGSEFGYAARSLSPDQPAKLSRLGDIELGLRYAILRGPSVRAVLSATTRLPTGIRDLASDFLDIGPGDRQLDFEWGVEAAIEPGSRLGVWLAARYTLQLGDRLERRITSPDHPIALASTLAVVERNLGDIFEASLHPTMRLNPRFRVFVSGYYRRKGADSYSLAGAPVPELEALTQQKTWSFGAGIWYRSEEGRRGGALPVEAGLLYRTVFSGSGGLTPKSNRLQLSLRLFYRLWGGVDSPPPTAPPPQ